MTAPALIQLDHASVMRSQVRVLHHLTLSIAQGQHTALLGPNGCGKSTFIKLITRELYPLPHADGRIPVRILGQQRWKVDQLRDQLGIVTGDLEDSLAGQHGLDVLSAVLSGFFASHVLPSHREISDAMHAAAMEALARVGMATRTDRAYAELSAGQQRRVLIARALVNHPRALLLDEPTTGLDVVARHQLVATLSQLARQGITLLLVSHHVEEIVPEIQRVLLMRDGRIIADGPRDEVLRDGPLSDVFGAPLQVVEQEGRAHLRVIATTP